MLKLGKSPHRAIKRMQEDAGGGMLAAWFGDYYTIFVSDPLLAKEMWGKQFMNFSDRKHKPIGRVLSGGYKNLISADYEKWKPLRAMVSNTFTKTKLKALISIIEEQVSLLTKKMDDCMATGQPFYPAKYCKKFSMNITLMICFSKQIPYEESVEGGVLDHLIHPIETIFEASAQGKLLHAFKWAAPLVVHVLSKKIANAHATIHKYIRTIYDEKLTTMDPTNPRDLFEEIVNSDGKAEDLDTVIGVAIDLLLAGTDTSESTIEWAMLYMCNFPDIQEKLHAELASVIGVGNKVELSHRAQTPYTVAFIKEVLRIRPIAPFGLNRTNQQEATIGGYFIPQGTQLLINIYGIHHNPKYWPNPEQLIPERFLNQENVTNDNWIPFGIGQRNCVGLNLAMDEIYMAVANISLKYKLKSATGETISDAETYRLTLHPVAYGMTLESRGGVSSTPVANQRA
ncbi:hypothetical protein SAMD00019534_084230 [Acytostelium subglobosum LB1]|uniref:hypothetical protein n=1 Tax=Acytostelium subglobosum LB1 TaxID=1410327 RepID=UPI0006448B3E|nr:hypothetical protein SAMD00019534_084230 [Acytostelium subglobosum LB1]GAM25248.1 hypothetical protein SAMD00019534_084230 [Acytostelium subglobosum LB1]|eukprot:XP_012751768.1 hypothetical protein SAMD00019534_084230 [Acytostelium subglobosum LB1]